LRITHLLARLERPPFATELMLRIDLLQQIFQHSDPAMEDALYDIQLYREFAGQLHLRPISQQFDFP
jgi:hypothetical protein